MVSKLGENMQREWAEEAHGGELWDALQVLKQDHEQGIAMLTAVAVRGSKLAMMYLGHEYISRGEPDNAALGEEWLVRSAEGGSIEGGLQLALHYQQMQAWDQALAKFKALAGRGYTPAMYYVGRSLYRGDLGYRSVPEALVYLKTAKAAGHLPSIGLLSHIYRKEKLGLSARIASHWLCLTKIPALVRCIWSYPNSDRLRPFGFLQRVNERVTATS